MKRKWTRGEKWLWAAPLIFIVAAGVAAWGPQVVRRQLGRPKVLTIPTDRYIRAIALSRDGSILAATGDSGAAQNKVYFWNARTLQPSATWDSAKNRIGSYDNSALSLSPLGDTVVLAPFDNGRPVPLVSYNRRTQTPKWALAGGFFQSFSQFSPDGTLVASAQSVMAGVEYVIVRAADGKVISRWKIPDLTPELSRLAWAPDGQTVIAIGAVRYSSEKNEAGAQLGQCTLEVRRACDGQLLRSGPSPVPVPENLAIAPDGRSLVTLSMPDIGKSSAFWQVEALDIATGRARWKFQRRDVDYNRTSFYMCSDVVYAPDGKTLVALEPSSGVVFWLDAHSGALKRTLKVGGQIGGQSAPDALAFSPDGKRLYARGQNAVLVWDLD